MTLKTKLKTSISYVAYGKAKNAQWEAEHKLDGSLEKSRQTSRLLVDELIANDVEQIDLIAEPKKEKPIRDAVVFNLVDPMPAKKKALLNLKDKKELHKRASKEMVGWCTSSYIALQNKQIDNSNQRTFIRKADVKNFLTSRINTAVDDLKAMVAYRLGEEKLSSKDGKAGIAPTKRADKKAVKKERVDTAPKSDKEKIHAQINNAITITQNSKAQDFNKVEILVQLQKIVKLLK